MRAGPNAIAVLHYFEQCRLEAYPDPATGGAPWTIGWGDTGPDVVPGLKITQADADARFERRLAGEFEPGVLGLLKRTPTQAQFDAMVSFAYNLGVDSLASSTLLRMFNTGQPGVEDQFPRWNKANGKVMLGLTRRRAAERALYLGKTGAEAIAIGAAIT